MRTETYTTWEEREQLCADAHAAGEQMFHDNHMDDGTKELVFDTPRPDWVSYFQDIMPDGEALEGTPVDMAEARAHHMTQIRLARDQELANLDVPFMQAIEDGDTAAQTTITGKKKALRDLPATFDLSTKQKPATLMEHWPSELPARG